MKRTFTTNSAGQLPDPGLPYSVYDVCADNGLKHVSANGVSVKDLGAARRCDLYVGERHDAIPGACPMSSERGFTLVEMLVAISLSLVVMLGIFALVEVTNRGSTRIASRVEADQLARPVMQRLLDELHSTCVGPNTTPVLPEAATAR